MKLPDQKVIVMAFVGLMALMAFFGFDLKQLLQEKMMEWFSPLEPNPDPSQQKTSNNRGTVFQKRDPFFSESNIPPTVSPFLSEAIQFRSSSHPITSIQP